MKASALRRYALLLLPSFFVVVFSTTAAAVDTDGDGVQDPQDNCTLVSNPAQLDADGDGYGNICDADINNSGAVTSA